MEIPNLYPSQPILSLTRQFMDRFELLVLFLTKRCRYQCSFCTLPSRSSIGTVWTEALVAQLRTALNRAGEDLPRVTQVAFGNEGSILDEKTMALKQLATLVNMVRDLPRLRHYSLETRFEFVTPSTLDAVRSLIGNCSLTIKTGLETLDEHTRQVILSKRLDLGEFERGVVLLGSRGVRLSCYVLVKCHPTDDDVSGREKAIETCRYVKDLCSRNGTPLLLRINAMYAAAGSPWAAAARHAGWTPPSIFDIADVMAAVRDATTPVYAGLFEEGLSELGGSMEARADFDKTAFDLLFAYNKTQNPRLLEEAVRRRRECRS